MIETQKQEHCEHLRLQTVLFYCCEFGVFWGEKTTIKIVFSRASDNNPKRYQDWDRCHDEMTTDICTHNYTNEIY